MFGICGCIKYVLDDSDFYIYILSDEFTCYLKLFQKLTFRYRKIPCIFVNCNFWNILQIVACLGVLVYKFYGEELREMFGYDIHPYGFYTMAGKTTCFWS